MPNVRPCMEAVHNIHLMDYASFEAAKCADIKFIQDSVDKIWYKDLKDPCTFYNYITMTTLLAHLDANCGGPPHPVDLVNLPSTISGTTPPQRASQSTSTHSRMPSTSLHGPNSQCLMSNCLPSSPLQPLSWTISLAPPMHGRHCHRPLRHGQCGRQPTTNPTLHANDN
jgi:hypothetical protein